MSNNTNPPPVPPYSGPGSPQDVPPLPGSFGVDPATLKSIRPTPLEAFEQVWQRSPGVTSTSMDFTLGL